MANDRGITIPPWCVADKPSTPDPLSHVRKTKRQPMVSKEDANALMTEIVEVCRRRGLWLAHEDAYGAFLVQTGPTGDWLMAACPADFNVNTGDGNDNDE